jgi:superfamily I DNA/RNA helicase
VKNNGIDLHKFLGTTILDNFSFSKQEHFDNKVNLMTFHSGKRLEFSVAFLAKGPIEEEDASCMSP